MRKSKHFAPKPYEIKCVAVEVELKEKYLKLFDYNNEIDPSKVPEEAKNHLFTPSKLAEKYEGFVGVTLKLPMLYVLYKAENVESAIKFFDEIKSKYTTKLVKNSVFADKRYLEGAFKGKMITLPPDFVDEAIRELLEKYCYSVEINEDMIADTIEYVGNLGGREASVFLGHGDKIIVAGLKNGNALVSRNVCGTYKDILNQFEKIILEWRETHKGVAKKLC